MLWQKKSGEKLLKSYYPNSQVCDRTELKSKETPQARKVEGYKLQEAKERWTAGAERKPKWTHRNLTRNRGGIKNQ